ncbi:MAG: glycosyltransferase family 2 protein [Rhodomicrobium sp.]
MDTPGLAETGTQPALSAAASCQAGAEALASAGTTAPIAVDICICTFQRPQIEDAIRSVAEQALPPNVRVRLTIADNSIEGSAREAAAQAAKKYALGVDYLHAPGANISIARNACLDYAVGDWIAFLDDDETASPGWLAALLAKSAGADIVFGPVQAIYGAGAPAWLRAGDFHSARVVYCNGRIDTGYSGNVLMRRSEVEAANIRFDLAYGISGGEDTLFFGRLAAAGLRLAEAPEALAFEPVHEQRATLRWLGRRSLRAGQSHAAMGLANSGSSISLSRALLSAAKTGVCLIGAVMAASSALGWRRWLLRGLLHTGKALRFAGVKINP